MKTLSIDPSSTATGWAVWDGNILKSHGVIRPKKKYDADERSRLTVTAISDLLYAYEIGQAIYEEAQKIDAYGRKNIHIYKKAVRRVMARLVSELGEENVYPIDPQGWKGNVKKAHTIRIVNLTYGLELTDDNEADAIGIGQWFLKRQKIDPIKPVGG